MTLEGPRLLAQVLTGGTITNKADGDIDTTTGVWREVAGTTNAAVQRDYYDLSGYNRDFLTTFIQGVEIQEPGPLTGTDTNNQLLEIISTELITDADIVAFTAGAGFNGPGFTLSTENMDQVIYGRRRLYTQDTGITPPIPHLHYSSSWGTASGVTADKVHLTRILITSTASSVTNVSDANFVMAIVVSKEAELPFLMRQKRSYELATGP